MNMFTATMFSFVGVELLGGELTASPVGTKEIFPSCFSRPGASRWEVSL